VTIANIITLLRIVLVPVIIWALLSGETVFAFIVFLLAGISDAVDGAVARMMDQQTEFGTALDPIADKLMLVSVFLLLAWLGEIPLWLAILVLSRDVLIIVGFLLAFVLGKAVAIRPLFVSKANTFAQIVLAALVMGLLAFDLQMPVVKISLVYATALLTAVSAIAYTVQGMRYLAGADNGDG